MADGVPRNDLFAEPLSVAITPADPRPLDDGGWLVRFTVEVTDREGKRCPDLAVAAELEGPGRTGRGEAHTDLFGRVRFQREGPAGDYRLRLVHVAGHALDLERPLEQLTARTEVG